jgi:hypothetical protein
VGRALADGSGRLADGTWWEKKSGIEYGKVRAVEAAVLCCYVISSVIAVELCLAAM